MVMYSRVCLSIVVVYGDECYYSTYVIREFFVRCDREIIIYITEREEREKVGGRAPRELYQ